MLLRSEDDILKDHLVSDDELNADEEAWRLTALLLGY